MTGSPGEMPFLDHLEELRWRILRSLGAIVVGFGIGLWLVQQFQLVNLLKQPIAPYLTGAGGKLIVTSPTEPVMIVFKLGFIVGLVLASPIILWQLWAFLAPALYAREKRALVPALFVGLLLFLTGAALAYVFVVPQALRVLFSFQTEAIQPFITYDNYFDFVLQVVLALGISFELPLVIIILAWLDVIGAGRAGAVPPLRGRGRLRRRRDPLAGHRSGLDDHDDDPAAPALRGGVRGRRRDRAPAAEGRRDRRRSCSSALGARRRAGAEAQVPVKPQRPPAPGGRAGLAPGHDPQEAGPGARQRHRRPARHPHRAQPAASRPTTPCSRRSRRARATSPPATGPTPPRSSSRSERVLLQGQALTERQGAHARGRHHPLPARQLHAGRRAATRTCSTADRCWWAKASATTPAAGGAS